MRTKLTEKQKADNRESRKAERAKRAVTARIESERNQKPVKSLTISIEWKKSRMWGNNPTAEGRIEYVDGTFGKVGPARASGCGYDKESTVIAEIFNACLKYKLWLLSEKDLNGSNNKEKVPYGIHCYKDGRGFAGGIGTSCYHDICTYLGGTFSHTASGRSFDVYTATF